MNLLLCLSYCQSSIYLQCIFFPASANDKFPFFLSSWSACLFNVLPSGTLSTSERTYLLSAPLCDSAHFQLSCQVVAYLQGPSPRTHTFVRAAFVAGMELGFVLLWLTLLDGVAPVSSAAQVCGLTRFFSLTCHSALVENCHCCRVSATVGICLKSMREKERKSFLYSYDSLEILTFYLFHILNYFCFNTYISTNQWCI